MTQLPQQFGVKLRTFGPFACFTRPEMKAERVSYDVITPSAARGILESIYWKPQIRWRVTRLQVCRPIRWISIRRNEVGSKVPVKGPTGAAAAMDSGRGRLGLVVEDDRQQRAATILRDVEYIVEAQFDVIDSTDSQGRPLSPTQAAAKHLDQFNRRLASGQVFHRPYMGCREFAAEVAPVDVPATPCPDELRGSIDLGFMLLDIDFRDKMSPLFYRAQMRDGVIEVPHPESPEVRK